MENIHIIHTNDLHSHFENWPRIRRYIQNRREELQALHEEVIVLDLGDFVDRVHPLTEATNGQANIELMNQVGYDGATIGNNEGVGNGKGELDHLYDQANFDLILGNLIDPEVAGIPKWAKPYKIITTKAGTKIALLALTAPFPLTYNPNGWEILFVDEVLPHLLEQVKQESDIIVLMSHLGIDVETKIAQEYPEISVVLGSHTHHLFPEGQVVGETLLAAAGKFGYYIGEVALEIEAHHIVDKTAKVILTESLPAIPQDQIEIDRYIGLGHQLLQNQQVADLPFALETELNADHPIIDAGLEALKERVGVEAAILNTGLFLEDLPKGVVDQDQLHKTLPHPMHLIRVSLTGVELIRLVGEMEKIRGFLRKFPIVGMGFRGKIFGEIVYSGIAYQKATKTVLWQGEVIEPDRIYQFATVDHYLFVPFFPTIELAAQTEMIFPEVIRTVLGQYLQAHYPIQTKKDIIDKNE